MNTEDKLFIRWDTSDLIDAQAKHLLTEGEANTEAEAWEQASQDSDFVNLEWSHLVESLTTKLTELNPDGYWHCDVENFGWRSLSGSTEFETNDGQVFLYSFLPDTDCTFNVYIDEERAIPVIKIQNFHHDSPTGKEWYTIVAKDADAIAA